MRTTYRATLLTLAALSSGCNFFTEPTPEDLIRAGDWCRNSRDACIAAGGTPSVAVESDHLFGVVNAQTVCRFTLRERRP